MPTKSVLVVGGCGYIGSHMVAHLRQAGFTPVVLDNLSTGHRDAVHESELVLGDMADSALLERLFADHSISAVMHFASYIEVGESVTDPAKYYQNNVAATLNLLNAMRKANVNHFIFSSTAAVYGEPRYTPIDEKHPLEPISPYGHSKLMVERILKDYSAAYGLHFAVLRYFNAAGAAGVLCERHNPESHLIPLVLQVAKGQRPHITVFGNDYSTPDGSCIRDYVHVVDLCEAHLLAMQALQAGNTQLIYNLGTGEGYSVQEVIATAKVISGCDIPVIVGQRRAGDPAVLIADARLAQHELRWQPIYSQLQTIIQHAWAVS